MAAMKRLVIASNNKKKVDELRTMLLGLGVEPVGLDAYPGARVPEETGLTFEENAVIKARAALDHCGVAALADDSGLAVDFLDGAPGVHSARFAGEDTGETENNLLLLKRLAGVPPAQRRAAFVAVVALALPTGEIHTFRGETHGVILEKARGEGGFGYDPLFLSDDLGVSFAEADPVEKNRVSHRGRALAKLAVEMSRFLCAIG